MKTVIILLCAVMIGFGYLLSDRIKTETEITRLQQQVSQLERDRQTLQLQLEETRAQLTQTEQLSQDLTEQNQAQAETVRQLTLTITHQKNQIAALQTEITLIGARTSLQSLLANTLKAGVFLPVIPAVLATTYLVVRSQKHTPRNRNQTTNPRGTWVQLTPGEIQTLIRMRRKQYR